MFKGKLTKRPQGNKTNSRRFLTLVVCVAPIIVLALSLLAFHPAFATDATPAKTESSNITETIFFGNVKDDGGGCGVFSVLNLVIDIFSIGVGVLATIGIILVGIKYLTAGGNEEQTRKAKQRMLQIVIGIVAYALLYTGAQWLLPGGKLDSSNRCATISNEELSNIKAKEKAEREAQRKKNEQEAAKLKPKATGPSALDKDALSKLAPAQRLSTKALELAWPANTSKSKYVNQATPAFTAAMKATGTNKGESGCRKSGQACGMFVGTVVRAAGIDPKFPTMASQIYPYVRDSRKWKQVSTKNPQPGDISLSYFSGGSAGHVSIYVKNKKGKTVTAQASLCDFYGVMEDRALYTSSSNKTFRYIGK